MPVGSGTKLRITAVMKLLGIITIENVYDVLSKTNVSSDLDVMLDCAAWLDLAYTELIGQLSTGLTFVEVRGFNVTADEPLIAVPWPVLTAGTATTDIVATAVSALALFHTAKSRVIGRKFIGGWVESAVDAGHFVASALGHLADYAEIIRLGPFGTNSGGDFEFNVKDKLGLYRPVLRVTVNAIPGYQRRRREGVGS